MWDLDHKESWMLNNCCFWTVVLEKTLESPLDCKEIQPVQPKGNQSWIFIGRTDVEAETPILWPPDEKIWLLRKYPDAEKDWGQKETGTTEDEMVGWHHRLNGHEFEHASWVGDGQRSLACCSPWGRKESDATECLTCTEGLGPLVRGQQVESCDSGPQEESHSRRDQLGWLPASVRTQQCPRPHGTTSFSFSGLPWLLLWSFTPPVSFPALCWRRKRLPSIFHVRRWGPIFCFTDKNLEPYNLSLEFCVFLAAPLMDGSVVPCSGHWGVCWPGCLSASMILLWESFYFIPSNSTHKFTLGI